jgi:hypothetical protein
MTSHSHSHHSRSHDDDHHLSGATGATKTFCEKNVGQYQLSTIQLKKPAKELVAEYDDVQV